MEERRGKPFFLGHAKINLEGDMCQIFFMLLQGWTVDNSLKFKGLIVV